MHQGKLTDAQKIWRKEGNQNKQKKAKIKPAVLDKQQVDLAEEDDFFAAPEEATKPNKTTKKVPNETSEEVQDESDDDDEQKSRDSESDLSTGNESQ